MKDVNENIFLFLGFVFFSKQFSLQRDPTRHDLEPQSNVIAISESKTVLECAIACNHVNYSCGTFVHRDDRRCLCSTRLYRPANSLLPSQGTRYFIPGRYIIAVYSLCLKRTKIRILTSRKNVDIGVCLRLFN